MRSCCAVYVDVGYLLAAAATRVTGSSLRRGIQADYESLIAWLVEHAETDSGLPLLRVNWYDAGGRPGGMPDASQDEIGQLARVKLRLGRLSYSGEQKGVDVRIGLDLAIQARQRVADVVYLVSGDDDLTEAVEDAQSHGVQVVLLAVPRHDEKPLAVSKHLLREVDRTQVISQEAIDHAFKPTAIPEALIPSPDDEEGAGETVETTTGTSPGEAAGELTIETATPVPGPSRQRRRTIRVHEEPASEAPTETAPQPSPERPKPQPPGTAPASPAPAAPTTEPPAQGASEAPAPTPAMFAQRKAGGVTLPGASSGVPVPPADEPGITLAVVDAVARQVVAAWCWSATPDALAALKAAAPVIPSELDRALLVDLSSRADDGDLDDETRHQVRARFWYHIGRVRPV